MENIIAIAQIVIAAVLVILILFQQRGTGLGSAFGQESGFYTTQRGIQKKIFWATIGCSVIFLILAVVNLVR